MSYINYEYFVFRKEDEKMLQDLTSVIHLFEDDCGVELSDAYINLNRLFLKGINEDDSCELMLRLWKQMHTLVIARIKFIHKRQCQMTKLVKLLSEYGRKNGYKKLIIESAQSEEIQSFCAKNSFVPISGTMDNWEINIEKDYM